MYTDSEIKRLFTTGEFAKLCHVKKQTLFHYDDIGLLSPEVKLNNGYRYYSYDQFELFHIINLFKELDIPLSEIKKLVHQKNPKETVNVLKNKSIEIENKIKQLTYLQKMLEVKINLAEQALEKDSVSITIQYLDEERYMLSENILNLSERKFIAKLSEFIHHIQSKHLDLGYPLGAILQKQQILEKDFYHYSHVYMKVSEYTKEDNIHKRPGGYYVIGYQIGDTAEETYAGLKEAAEQNGYDIGSNAYEEYVFDGIFFGEKKVQVTKICLQLIEKQKQN
ncbi:MerR family transcriptional regulator [Psychrobacillus sp. FSL K6-2684]|uniref:MerR family transcriptional regulator n=1 Tax=Psychrobacillus sp. FSL K6-2684 TaxID=2921547 RepID=UPI00119EDB94